MDFVVILIITQNKRYHSFLFRLYIPIKPKRNLRLCLGFLCYQTHYIPNYL